MAIGKIYRALSGGKKLFTETLGNKTVTQIVDNQGRQILLRTKTINKSFVGGKKVISRNDTTFNTLYRDKPSLSRIERAQFSGEAGAQNHVNYATSVTRDIVYNGNGQRIGERIVSKNSRPVNDGTMEDTLAKLEANKTYQKILTDYNYTTRSYCGDNGIKFSHQNLFSAPPATQPVLQNCNPSGLPVPDVYVALGYDAGKLSGSLRELTDGAYRLKQNLIRSYGFTSFDAIKDTPNRNYDFLRRLVNSDNYRYTSGLHLS